MSALNLEPVHDLLRAPGSLGGPAGTLPERPAKRDRFVVAGHKPRGNPAGSAPLRGRPIAKRGRPAPPCAAQRRNRSIYVICEESCYLPTQAHGRAERIMNRF